jgi:hypothetical protein
MKNLVYTIAAVLVILWLLGYFFTNMGSSIHLLLVIAVILILVRVIKG